MPIKSKMNQKNLDSDCLTRKGYDPKKANNNFENCLDLTKT